jgi:hypothetical protein
MPAVAALAALVTVPLHAQRLAPAAAPAVAATAFAPTQPPSASDFPDGGVGAPWQRVTASLIVPGSGQLMAGQPRGLVYLAVEVWALARAIALDHRGDERARQYRDLAYSVARQPFAPVRVDGPFEYYETMEKFVESGAFDADPGPAFQPEQDPRTYNGSVWLLARRTYFADPDSLPPPDSPAYLSAVAFYRGRAATDQFLWSWRNARLEQDVFASQIRASDVAYQQRTNYLGLLVLNHVASAVDALISSRLGGRRVAPRLSFPGPTPAVVGLRWSAGF